MLRTGLLRALVAVVAFASTVADALCKTDALFEGFTDVPAANRPWCYWWWLNGHVDKETITADLEAMKKLGFGGLLMFDSRGYWDDDDHLRLMEAEIEFGSSRWQDFLAFSVREAARLGLEFTINISSSGGKLDGPWNVGEDAPKQLMYELSELPPSGGFVRLQRPALAHYRDIALFAVAVDGKAELGRGWRKALVNKNAFKVRACRELPPCADGTEGFSWTAPDDGRWVLMRFGYCTMPGHERDVDMLDPGAVTRHWRRLMDPLKARVGDLFGKTLTHVYSVSWEGAIPTWTKTFEADFEARSGYRLRSFLPCLGGCDFDAVRGGSGAPADLGKLVEDFCKVRNLIFRDNFYGTMKKLARAEEMKLYSESAGPWRRTPETFLYASQMAFYALNDMPQGEFWYRLPHSPSPLPGIRGAVAAAHVYARPRASAEAFTHMMQHWSAFPAGLKYCGDEALVDGINHFVWHTFTCSPKKFGVPGHEYFAGTHINANVTWHKQAGAFIGYLGRCQWMLQQGMPVADFAVWGGTYPYQGWGRHRRRPYKESKLELARTSVYDLIDTHALVELASAENGLVKFPGGMSYKMLVLDPANPGKDMTGEVKAKVEALRAAGAVVVAPEQAQRALSALRPDFSAPEPFLAVRRMTDNEDIYFVTGQGKCEALFRARGKCAELWDPVDGTRRRIEAREKSDGLMALSLDLPKDGSTFVVFRTASNLDFAAETGLGRRIAVCGPWKAEFFYHEGIDAAPPAPRNLALGDFSRHEDPAIAHFSGTIVYTADFTLGEADVSRAELSLGDVVGGLARISVNEVDLGVVWTAPWKISVPQGVLRCGENRLQIRFVNTWANMLIRDCSLEIGQRLTSSNLAYRKGVRVKGIPPECSGYVAEEKLFPNGLMGPVELICRE